MRNQLVITLCASALLLSAAPTAAALQLSRALGNSMVLQRDSNATKLWGFDTAGSTVSVTFNSAVFNGTTGADGVWRVPLPATPAGGPYTLTAVSSAGGSVALSDVLFGDVVFVSGQSNAVFPVSAAFNASAETAAANYPRIRVMTVGQGTQAKTPLTDLVTVEQNWTAATPHSIGENKAFTGYFSAIGYFYARDLYNALNGTVPIGVIVSAWGGTCINHWAPREVINACGGNHDSELYNAMVAPFMVGPMPVTTFLQNNTELYQCLFPKTIESWRASFGVPNATYGFELLPGYIRDANYSPLAIPYERAAQLTALALPNVVVSNAMDLGDPTAPHTSVHPRNKQDVAARFVAASLATTYGRADVLYRSPSYRAATAITAGDVANVLVTFDPDSIAPSGLYITPKACPVDLGVPAAECAWHEVQTTDGAWHNATTAAVLSGRQSLLLTATLPPASAGLPVNATRSSFSPYPVVTLYSAGFPALPWWEAVDAATTTTSRD